MEYSEDIIQKTIEVFQPHYDKYNIELNEVEAIEILDNASILFEALMELDKKGNISKKTSGYDPRD